MKFQNLRPFAIMPTEVLCDKSLTGTDLRVYGVIASCLNDKTKRSWPGQGTIAVFLTTDKSNVKRSVKRLLKAKYICKVFTGGGFKRSNQYTIKRFNGGAHRPPHKEPVFLPEGGGPGDTGAGVHRPPNKNIDIPLPSLPASQDVEIEAQIDLEETIAASVIAEPDGSPLVPLGSPDGDHVDEPDGSALVPLGVPDGPPLSSTGTKSKISADTIPTEPRSSTYARSRLIQYFGLNSGAMKILLAADDPNHPDHTAAVEACLKAAKELGIGWKPRRTKK